MNNIRLLSLGRVRTYGFRPASWQRYKRWIDKAATQGPAGGWDEYITLTATRDLGQYGSRSRAPLTKSAASVTRRAEGEEGTAHVGKQRANEKRRGRGFVIQSPLWHLAALEQGLQNWPASQMQGLFTTRPHSIKSVSWDDVCECVCQPMASFIQQGRQNKLLPVLMGPPQGPLWIGVAGSAVASNLEVNGNWGLLDVWPATTEQSPGVCVCVRLYKSKQLPFYYIVQLFL